MASTNSKTQCFLCKKETRTFNCEGCSLNFCLNCLNKHIQDLTQQFDQLENDHDEFREKLNDRKNNPKQRLLIKEINQWEIDSIHKIKQKAKECRQRLINYTNIFIIDIENELNNIVKELKQIRQQNEFNEIDINQCKQQLNKLKEEFDKPTNVSIKKKSTSSFINNISVIIPLDKETSWKQSGITIIGGHGQGNQLNQVCNPEGIFIDDSETIYVADLENHRIIEWKSNAINGQIIADGKGTQTNQLNFPVDIVVDREINSLLITDNGNRRVMQWSRQNKTNGEVIISNIDCLCLTVDKYGSVYVSDYMKNEVRKWKRGEKDGTLVAGGHGKGNGLNQFNCPTYLFIDKDDSLYVSDRDNHRIMKWIKDAEEGIIVAGGNGQGSSLTQLSSPRGVIVDQLGQIYVADCHNNRVMRWRCGIKEGRIIVGGNGQGKEANQFNGPTGLSFDREGNLYVVDKMNHRIQKFKVE